jgi:predicted MFS family arabinose efflux permease
MARLPAILTPLRYRDFRYLWIGMGASYAGDRLQEMAQAWLVASLTGSSALAVGAIGITASIPQLLMPVGGAIADLLDKRRLIIVTQIIGALAAAVVGWLVYSSIVAPWHIYAWAFLSGGIWLLTRPAYKVILTESVPVPEVRPAVAINSMTETLLIMIIAAVGSLLLARFGLTLAFILNALSYLAAALCLWLVPRLGHAVKPQPFKTFLSSLPGELWAGFAYLVRRPRLLQPIVLTFSIAAITTPMFGLLAAVVHAQGGSIVSLGMLSAATGLGALLGAVYAGWRDEGRRPIGRYAFFGLLAAAGMIFFALTPISAISAIPLALVGFVLFSQAVWNTSRVRLLADPPYQARLQALTTMAFTMAGALGMAWGGIALDRIGAPSLVIAALLLVSISLGFMLFGFRDRPDLSA